MDRCAIGLRIQVRTFYVDFACSCCLYYMCVLLLTSSMRGATSKYHTGDELSFTSVHVRYIYKLYFLFHSYGRYI